MSRVTKAAGPADAHGAGTCWPFQRSRVCTGRTALSAALGLLSQPMASLHDLTRPWIWEGAAGPLRGAPARSFSGGSWVSTGVLKSAWGRAEGTDDYHTPRVCGKSVSLLEY